MKTVAVFGSGNGSNFEAIIKHFQGREVKFICISDKKDSFILKRAKKLGIESLYLPHEEITNYLKNNQFDLVALAGYMRVLPAEAVKCAKIINVHPSLLPAFKGKDAIKQAYDAGASFTGVTVHYVTEEVDAGPVIVQLSVIIRKGMTLSDLEDKVHEAEHKLYPLVVDNILFRTPLDVYNL